MTESSQAATNLDARLAELDHKLCEIQAGLAPGRSPSPRPRPVPSPRPGPVPSSQPGPASSPVQQPGSSRPDVSALEELTRLLSSLHEVLNGIETMLGRMSSPAREATVTAGPFATIGAVREFERELAAVPGVRAVAIRGYEGPAHAVIDVQFGQEPSR